MPEIWNDPRFCIAFREADVPAYARPWMRREPCCDCGETIVFSGARITWALVRPFLYICCVCAKHREIECGGTAAWTHDVRPRPRPA